MPCIAAFFVSAVHCQGARQAGYQGFSVIAHQARLAPADTFISAGWACPTAPSGVAFTPLQGWKTPEKQPPATNYGSNGIHG
ncbi:TPA: hypothetical protein QDZ99_004316 [Stenotrophomonas maltophilia]|nr:hypothetical protein [Stenotrophomonas maltophilia]MRI42112.1 hypothetical protein [Stenotrophomonas sp. MH181796]MBA0323147.1 hypothetical protein [Stenotrophomonas maltophilia]MBA0430068.1 hypothetical protein [Stenotrophomonas maltophilia]PZP76980.1 MAG: hypothetical protein DI592_18195 [Stenotrophomonas maltophilia]